MAIPGLTYRLVKGTSLTHLEMDNNFRSVFYSSSIKDNGDTLILHYDTDDANDVAEIALNAGTGGVTIQGNTDNRVLTATGGPAIQGESNFTFDGSLLTINGRVDLDDGSKNLFLGPQAGSSIAGAIENIAIGFDAGVNLTGAFNTALGQGSLRNTLASSRTVSIGYLSLNSLTSGNSNVSIGTSAGINLTSGAGNVHLGNAAGPASSTAESNKLYINNTESDTPLILGDFTTGHVTINSTVSASIFSGSYYGDGSNLTGLTAAAEWDGTLDGNAQITGSLIVSGTAVTVDFTNVENISGSIFSGSFVGDGSGLTGVQADTFPYTGSAKITGSLDVIGDFEVSGNDPFIKLKSQRVTVDKNIQIWNGNQLGFSSVNIGIGKKAVLQGGCTITSTGTEILSSYNIGIGEATLSGRRHLTYSSISGQYESDSRTSFNGNTAVGHYSQASTCTVGEYNTSLGLWALNHGGLGYNTAVGAYAMHRNNRRAEHTTAVGYSSLRIVDCGNGNTAYGTCTLNSLNFGSCNLASGYEALKYLKANSAGTGNTILYTDPPLNNTAIGARAGLCTTNGNGNVYVGAGAGPSVETVESNKLYINNNSGTALIAGDFQTGEVTINNCLKVAEASGSFVGDGSGLTGTEWNGSRNGDASITGSLVVSGSAVTVDLTNTLAISGSIFSGSFTGDGSGLTGITSEWDGTRNGNAQITGSLIVSGALDVSDTITLGSTGYPGSPGVELIHFHSNTLSGIHTIFDFEIGGNGYTGFKADYTLNTESEDEKKVGTLLGAWDGSGAETINDSHTLASGNIQNTSFSITSDGNNAVLKLDASTGTYNVNMLITAFKRQV